jgi:phosphatidylglycerol---prolipoprotein diacylglyceryl transferase
MYPNLYYFFRDVFDVKIGVLRFINSFGFFVAIAFLVAAALLAHELRRKSKLGLFHPTESKITVGKPASATEILLNFVLGFILGYKIIALFFLGSEATQDTQAYIFSGAGSLPAGLAVGLLFAWLKWRDGKKQQLAKPEERVVRIWPHDRVGEITIIALVLGLIGAKMFDIFENWSDFLKRPSDYIFSGGGLTFYGGLICSTIAIIWYARKHKFSVRHLADAIAPALMIAYAIGRIGCQVAGDGDWGIYNSAYKINPANEIVLATPADFKDSVQAHAGFFATHYDDLNEVHQTSFKKPGALGFLPNWFFAYNYPHNVNETGIRINGCNERYCNQLPIPVFPTPFYETLACTLLFFVLWGLRKRIQPAGGLFCLYLILNGLERFFIEKIRVNNRLDLFGFHPTQAEVISTGLVITGVVLWIFLRNKYRTTPQKL